MPTEFGDERDSLYQSLTLAIACVSRQPKTEERFGAAIRRVTQSVSEESREIVSTLIDWLRKCFSISTKDYFQLLLHFSEQ